MLLRKLLLLSFILTIVPQYSYAGRLLIKMATRGRNKKFFRTLSQYYVLLSGEIPTIFVISCDKDDPEMSPKTIKKLTKKFTRFPLYIHYGDNKSKIAACNANMEPYTGQWDVVLLASDDMVPVIKNFDKIIMNTMESNFPDYSGVLNFNDGFVNFTRNTYPVLGVNYYNKFGYIYYPEYKSLYCDEELKIVSQKLNKELIVDTVIIEHRHPCNGKAHIDKTYQRALKPEIIKHDQDLFAARAQINFELP